MRRGSVLLTGLLASLLVGCATDEPVKTTSWADRFHNLDFVNTADMVSLEVRLIESRIGDNYINRELWEKSLDEQVVAFGQRNMLNKNGLRAGKVAGALPTRLYDLMTLERTCVNPRRLLMASGKPSTIHLGPIRPQFSFQIDQQTGPVTVELEKAQCSLLVTPTLTELGKIHLRFVPKVEFGENVTNFHAAKDRSGWVMDIQRQYKTYPELGWEVTVDPNAFLIVGTLPDRPESLGFQAFVDPQALSPVQRLLVLRTTRSTDVGIDAEIAPSPITNPTGRTIPLAAQVLQPTARGASH